MAELWFDAEAEAALSHLESDVGRPQLRDAVRRILDQLERDPSDRSVRRHRLREPPLWGVTLAGDGEEWAVLWEPHPTHADEVVVQYLGPASFA